MSPHRLQRPSGRWRAVSANGFNRSGSGSSCWRPVTFGGWAHFLRYSIRGDKVGFGNEPTVASLTGCQVTSAVPIAAGPPWRSAAPPTSSHSRFSEHFGSRAVNRIATRTGSIRVALTPKEWGRVGGMTVTVLGLNLLGWGTFVL